MEIKSDIMKVDFLDSESYDVFKMKNFTIYCDPPYDGNKLGVSNRYSLFQNFDYNKFWNKMREWSKNNLVFISECIAPKDFIKIWSITSTVGTGKKTKSKKYNESLYIHECIYNKLSQDIK